MIWIVALCEGFSTLAVEVIAIRLAIPVVGSSMTLTGVMLGVVLFALSAGYWRGGELSARWDDARTRSVLMRNLLLAGAIYAAISFPLEAGLLAKLLDWNFGLAPGIIVASAILFVPPVYLASQTVPMLAELTNVEGKAGKASGKVLFFSTVGSVAGGIVTPIVLFPYLGVRASTYVICGLLVAAGAVMAIGRMRPPKIAAAALAVVAVVAGARLAASQGDWRFAFDSPHQSIRIGEEKLSNGRTERVMRLNGGRASGIYTDTGETSFPYVVAAGRALASAPAADVLVIGSAGFTFPRDATRMPFVERVDAVDVDPTVFEIAQRHFLLERLPAKVRFYPLSARFALREFQRQRRRYGMALLDAYSGMGIPDELLTLEFFRDVHAVADRVVMNVIIDPELQSAYARNTLATFRAAFGQTWIQNVRAADSDAVNFLAGNRAIEGSTEWNGAGEIYTDNHNTADRDHVALVWGDE